MAKPLSHICAIVFRRYDFMSLSLEKLLSADAVVTGIVR